MVYQQTDIFTPDHKQDLKRVLVFSPDEDLARVLLMNLEDRFCIIREHRLEILDQAIMKNSPDIILIDLFSLSEDITKQLEIVQRWKGIIPVIALRAYKSVTPEIDQLIEELTQNVFYKPVNGELITQAIEDTIKK